MNQKNKVFQGCFTKNRDSTNRLIIRSEKCLTPTDKPFWKYPDDITPITKTCSREKEQKKVTKGEFNKYFKEKEKQFRKLDIQRWLETSYTGSKKSDTELEVYFLTKHLKVF